jgi:hypothetical protein
VSRRATAAFPCLPVRTCGTAASDAASWQQPLRPAVPQGRHRQGHPRSLPAQHQRLVLRAGHDRGHGPHLGRAGLAPLRHRPGLLKLTGVPGGGGRGSHERGQGVRDTGPPWDPPPVSRAPWPHTK